MATDYNPDFAYQAFIKQLAKCQDDVIREILRQLLKREPVPEDAKRLTFGILPDDAYTRLVAFDGVQIGKMIYSHEATNYSIEFKPDPAYHGGGVDVL
jgi:hypothetical protein